MQAFSQGFAIHFDIAGLGNAERLKVRYAIFQVFFLPTDIIHNFAAGLFGPRCHQARAGRNKAARLLREAQRHGRCGQAARDDFLGCQADDGEFIEGDCRTNDGQRRGEAEGEIQPPPNGRKPTRAQGSFGALHCR